jgi:hypothetical protein
MRDLHSSGIPTDPTSPYAPVAVRVFLTNNFRDACLSGYQAHHSVTEVFTYTTARAAAATDEVLLEEVFRLFNVGDDPDCFGAPDARAVAYRRCGNRALSVGDVACLGNLYFACQPSGWDLIDAPLIEQRRSHGTTPLYEASAGTSGRWMARLRTAVRHCGWAARP